MSQASKKVKWCLDKAAREIAEAGFHRGLLKAEGSVELADKHVAKAEHNLSAALYFRKGGFSDWSTSAFFYCIYHCLLAIIRKHGYESRNQECTIAAIEALREEGKIKLDDKFIDTLKITKAEETDHSMITIREEFQYGVEMEFSDEDEFNELKNMCKELLNVTKDIILR